MVDIAYCNNLEFVCLLNFKKQSSVFHQSIVQTRGAGQAKELSYPLVKRKTSLLSRKDLRLLVDYLCGHQTLIYSLDKMRSSSVAECRLHKEQEEST